MSKQGLWKEMGERIDDEILQAFAVVGEPREVLPGLAARCEGAVDRLVCTFSFADDEQEALRSLLGSGRANLEYRQLALVDAAGGTACHSGERTLGVYSTSTGRDVVAAGNLLEHTGVTELFTGFGAKGVRAEEVAGRLGGEVRSYLSSGVPVGPHLADQLLIPMALAGEGAFLTTAPTDHTTTNIAVIERFLPVRFQVSPVGPHGHRIEVRGEPTRRPAPQPAVPEL